MVWAESLGVDIVNSSLGYNNGFSPPDTDYTFQDMNGVTTIVSKAAAMATQFGVIVVNSMGNDGPVAGSLSAPADVKDVVSAGAVDGSLSVADFSSRGPTSDGRIKPDCVALGVGACVPQVYNGNNNPPPMASIPRSVCNARLNARLPTRSESEACKLARRDWEIGGGQCLSLGEMYAPKESTIHMLK